MTYITASPLCSSLVELPAARRSLKKDKTTQTSNLPRLVQVHAFAALQVLSLAHRRDSYMGLFLLKIDGCFVNADQRRIETRGSGFQANSGFSGQNERLNG